MKCPKCKKPVAKHTKFCPNCGKKIKKTILGKIAIFLILVSIIASVAAIIIQKNVIVVKNADEVMNHAQKIGKEYGYENAFAELSEKSTIEFENDHYYRMQQNYKGIPVYGRDVIYVTNEKNEITNITGNPKDINEEIEAVPSITQSDVEYSIQQYISETFAYEGDFEIGEISEKNLCIYNYTEDEDAHLAYCIWKNGYEFLVDANSAEVLCANSTISEITGYAASDTEWENGFNIEKNEQGLYILADDSIVGVYDWNGVSSDRFCVDETLLKAECVSSKDIIFGNISGEESYEEAVHFYEKMMKIKKQCKEWFGYAPLFEIYFNDGYMNGQNALGGIYQTEKMQEKMAIVSTGYVTGTENIATMAHEYGHVIHFTIVYLDNSEVSVAIKEGIADTFGTILEGAYYGIAPSWCIENKNIKVKRDIKNPHNTGNAEYLNDTSVKPAKRNGYYRSTVISHAAYLMWNGIDGDEEAKISAEDILKLWYRAILTMPYDCDFVTWREKVEWAAQTTKNLTEKQRECISDAFYRVGIPTKRNLVDYDQSIQSNSVLKVYDSENKLCYGYKLDILGTITDLQDSILTNVDLKNNYEFHDVIQNAEEYRLDLPEGSYIITITSLENTEKSYTFSVLVSNEESENMVELYTDFVSILLTKKLDEEMLDVYGAYQTAVTQTIASGNWREEMYTVAVMDLSSKERKEKLKTNVTLEANANIQDYDADNLSKLKIEGNAAIHAVGQNFAWNVNYSDGIATYQHTEPTQYTEALEIDPAYFEFSSLTQDMMLDASIADGKIKFTVKGENMTWLISETTNMMNGIDQLECYDGTVEILLNQQTGAIDNINIKVPVSLEYQEYHAEVDYEISYSFTPNEISEVDLFIENALSVYAPVFKQYVQVIEDYQNLEKAELEVHFPFVNHYLITNYISDVWPIYYTFYDIDENGIPELLLSYATVPESEWKVTSVFSYDSTNEEIRRVGSQDLFSEFSDSYIYQDGTVYSKNSETISFYCINQDGYHLDLMKQYNEVGTYPDSYYFNDSEMLNAKEFTDLLNSQADKVVFDWRKFDESMWDVDSDTENSVQPSFTAYPEYKTIIKKYYQGLQADWAIQDFQESGLCYLAGYESDASKMGYYIGDLDNNGVEELLIGKMDAEDNRGMFYDLYTMSGGECIRVQSSGERDRYYLCENGSIANEGSNSALCSSWKYYDFRENQLVRQETVFTDGYYDEENPWFYTIMEPYMDYTSPITEEEAYQIINSYHYCDIPYISLAEAEK